MKFDTHVSLAVNKASFVLGQLKRTFQYWTMKNFLVLYTTYVRPHLEYAAPVWSPHHKKDIKALEKVQRRATKLVPSLKKLVYSDRLAKLGLTTLKERRNRGDLIQFFKINSGFNIVNLQRNIAKAPQTGTRKSHHSLVRPPISKISQREHCFNYRVIPIWNALPNEVIDSSNTNQFKNKLDKHLKHIT